MDCVLESVAFKILESELDIVCNDSAAMALIRVKGLKGMSRHSEEEGLVFSLLLPIGLKFILCINLSLIFTFIEWVQAFFSHSILPSTGNNLTV
uniref:Uncharacterized protein n=1 Tax=Lepeophtheirus salmonis TaxID=72036 RepID=A0A0K2UXH4_LEPSM